MSSWLIPANTKFYDVFAAFDQPETFWPVNAKISTGDVVFIYLTAPFKQVGFRSTVQGTGYDFDDICNQVAPFVKGEPTAGPNAKPFLKLGSTQAIAIDPKGPFSLDQLRHNGLTGMLMGARKLENNPQLYGYIVETFK